jgi:hypothetical protein
MAVVVTCGIVCFWLTGLGGKQGGSPLVVLSALDDEVLLAWGGTW